MKHNLVPLCKCCHLKVTNEEIIVEGWKETSKGKKLNWRYADKKNLSRKKKFSEKDIETIKDLKETYSSLSQTDFLKKIELSHGIKLSVFTLRKVLSNEY